MHRVFGLETEYGVAGWRDGVRPVPQAEAAAAILGELSTGPGLCPRTFLPNGALLYRDMYAFVEYATAEATTPEWLVAADRAGDAIVEALRRRSPADAHLEVFKANANSTSTLAFGSHENYLMARSNGTDTMRVLASFLATRPVWAGSGAVHARDPAAAHYEVTNRAAHSGAEAARSSAGSSKPMISTRDEPHADARRHRRLHVVSGDANSMQFPVWLRFASTALVLDVLEGIGAPAFDDLLLAEPLAAFRSVSADTDLRGTVELASGHTVTALDHQGAFASVVAQHVESVGVSIPDPAAAVGEWVGVCDALGTDLDAAVDRVEWVAKRRWLERLVDRRGLAWGDPVLLRAAIVWSSIDPDVGVARRLERAGLVRTIVPTTMVTAAVQDAPPGTRATQRARAVRWADRSNVEATVDWTSVAFDTSTGSEKFSMDDPFATCPDLERRIAGAPPAEWKSRRPAPVLQHEALVAEAIELIEASAP